MLRIGDFSKLTRISIRMLRYYDELGLLKPARVDPESGYRYYSAQQLPRLNRILALQDLGFSLEQVGRLLEHDLPADQLKGMLLLKQAELQERLLEEQARLARVAARLQQIEREPGPPAYEVILKPVETQLVASLRQTISSYHSVGVLFDELLLVMQHQRAEGLPVAVWYDEVPGEGVDAEATFYLSAPIRETARVKVYDLPGAMMASVVHHGSFLRLEAAYHALLVWIDQNRYRIAGASREVYLYYTLPSRLDDESYVTEIQFPVERDDS